MTILGRDVLLAACKGRKRVLVDVPELGGELYLQELSTAQLLEYNSLVLSRGDGEVPPTIFARAMAKLLVFSACDVDGTPLYTEADVDALAFNDIKVLMTLRKRIIEVSGLDKTVEEVADNLKNDQNGSSSSG